MLRSLSHPPISRLPRHHRRNRHLNQTRDPESNIGVGPHHARQGAAACSVGMQLKDVRVCRPISWSFVRIREPSNRSFAESRRRMTSARQSRSQMLAEAGPLGANLVVGGQLRRKRQSIEVLLPATGFSLYKWRAWTGAAVQTFADERR
jgi:hypothetical protein